MAARHREKEMVSLLGIDIHLLFTVAFALGAWLAGIAGALTAPIAACRPAWAWTCSASPSSWSPRRPRNLLGAITGLLIGVAQAIVAAYWTEASTVVIYAVMAAVLLVRRKLVRHQMKSNCPAAGGGGRAAARPASAIASEIWIFAILGLGLNLLLGYTGLLSFGQATFFGSAAYVAGWLLKHYGINVFLALGTASSSARPRGLVGYLCVQRSGLYSSCSPSR